MLFNSYIFILCFMPVFLIGFYAFRNMALKNEKDKTAVRAWLIACSLVFYAFFGWRNLVVLLSSIVINACLSYILDSCKRHNEVPRKRALLAAGVVINAAALLFFKYSGTFFPVAISFYTFNQISYLVDIGREDGVNFSIFDYLIYVLFFPKLLQGPMMGYSAFEKELDKSLNESGIWENLMRGLYLFSIGLFKKVILADTFGSAVDFGYSNLQTLSSLEAVLVAVFYSFQLYFDFSGYCDMASGLCKMMGLDLAVNFDSPYKAVDIRDFWNRWHITLTSFFTKYVYIPLGGSRKGRVRTYANILIVFLISGIWHGKGLGFIIWGMMHGILNALTRAVSEAFPARAGITLKNGTGKDEGTGGADGKGEGACGLLKHCIKIAFTFVYVTAAWVFFRAPSVRDAITLFVRMFTGGRKNIATGLSACFQLDEIWYVLKVTPLMKLPFAWDLCLWLFLAFAVFIIFFTKNAIARTKQAKLSVGTTLATFLLLIWSVVSFAGVSTFLYMNF